VSVAVEPFARRLGPKAHQIDRQRPDVDVRPEALLDVRVPGGTVTEAGLRNNVSVGIQYVASWLRGVGAAALYNLMEDAATAEISRSQVWQWIHHAVHLAEGRPVSREMVRAIVAEELAGLREAAGAGGFEQARFREAAEVFEAVALSDRFVEFLTLPAYDRIDL